MVKQLDHSIRQRLLNIAKARGDAFDFILNQFLLQRILYRISVSPYAEQFMLKGALLFWVWQQDFHRPTRDIDLLGFMDNGLDNLRQVFTTILQIEAADGLHFDVQDIQATEIKKDASYKGVRINGLGELAGARIPFQVDIGFGDAVDTVVELTEIPSLLTDMPSTLLRTYSVYNVIAEKFHAMVVLDVFNSRYKDFYDIYCIASTMPITWGALVAAINATFARRATPLSTQSLKVFTDIHKHEPQKQQQWISFINKNQLIMPLSFAEIVDQLELFLLPPYLAASTSTAPMQWEPTTWQWRSIGV